MEFSTLFLPDVERFIRFTQPPFQTINLNAFSVLMSFMIIVSLDLISLTLKGKLIPLPNLISPSLTSIFSDDYQKKYIRLS